MSPRPVDSNGDVLPAGVDGLPVTLPSGQSVYITREAMNAAYARTFLPSSYHQHVDGKSPEDTNETVQKSPSRMELYSGYPSSDNDNDTDTTNEHSESVDSSSGSESMGSLLASDSFSSLSSLCSSTDGDSGNSEDCLSEISCSDSGYDSNPSWCCELGDSSYTFPGDQFEDAHLATREFEKLGFSDVFKWGESERHGDNGSDSRQTWSSMGLSSHHLYSQQSCWSGTTHEGASAFEFDLLSSNCAL